MIDAELTGLCPCNSGKNYADCCFLTSETDPLLHKKSYPEKFVLGKLFSSPEFLRFYDTERRKIPGQIFWEELTDADESTRAQEVYGYQGRNMFNIIFLRRIPALLEDRFSVAHEIGHVLFDHMGFLGVSLNRTKFLVKDRAFYNYHKLATSVNISINDVMVNSLLGNYGFDQTAHLRLDMEKTLKALENWHHPQNSHNDLLLVSYYLKNALEYELISGRQQFEQTRYYQVYASKFPHLVTDGDEFIGMIKETGYDTVEKHWKIYRKILQKYGLSEYFIKVVKR